MAGSVYLRRVNAINRNQGANDVNRGLQVGQEVGKLLGGLAGAIKGAQKDQLANKMMTDADVASQPGAGQTQDLGQLPSDGGVSDDQLQQAMAASQLSSNQPSQDLGQLPSDSPMTPGPSGAQAPAPGPSVSDDQLGQAIAASRLGGGPTVGAVSPPGGPQPAAGGDFTLNPSDYSGPGKTVGGMVHTGGVQEMELQKQMLAQKMQQASFANSQMAAQAKMADAQAKASGTGPYALDAAMKRAQLAKAQQALQPKTSTKPDPNAPPPDLSQNPVANPEQLVKTFETTHGKGSFNQAMNAFNEPATIADPNNPGQTIPNPNSPVITSNTVSFGPANKRTNMPIGEAQVFTKQANAQRLKQNLPLLPVPGEDQSVGATADNPYPAKNKLDALSRAHGTWVKLPTGQVAQVP